MLRSKFQFIAISLCLASLVSACNPNDNKSNGAVTTASKPAPSPAAQSALRALRKMSGAVEIGISSKEYGSRMIDLKAEVEELLTQLPEGEVKKEVALALQASIDAKAAFEVGTTADGITPTYFEPVKSLMLKYEIPKRGEWIGPVFLVKTIWKAADKHIERATQVLNQPA
ncbi:MAG: hypothetical protein WCI39_02865 [Gallionellaceae bacterium]